LQYDGLDFGGKKGRESDGFVHMQWLVEIILLLGVKRYQQVGGMTISNLCIFGQLKMVVVKRHGRAFRLIIELQHVGTCCRRFHTLAQKPPA